MNKYDEFYKRVLENKGDVDDADCAEVNCKECILNSNNRDDGFICRTCNESNIQIVKDYFNQKRENKFNWEEFKQGKFAVNCDTEDKANDFLRECDKQGIGWMSGCDILKFNNWKIFNEDTIYYNTDFKLNYSTKNNRKNIKIINWEIKEYKEMTKTFKEVITDIKESEVWKWKMFTIELDKNNDIKITRIDGFKDCRAIFFNNTEKFTLQKPKYTFEQAIKAFKEGKTIISNNGEEYNISKNNEPLFLLWEIEGEWEIQ